MRKFLQVCSVAVVLGLGTGFAAWKPVDDIYTRQAEMLNPSVLIDGGVMWGSGTVIHCSADAGFVLTNHHVVENLLEKAKGAPTTVDIDLWTVTAPGSSATHSRVKGTVVAFQKDVDLALIEIKGVFLAKNVAKIDYKATVQATQTIFAAGAGLGNRPFVTQGLVSTEVLDKDSDSEGSILISAPIIEGNSGGSAYELRDGHYIMVGVPFAMMIKHEGMQEIGVPHMAVVIPMSRIRNFLADKGYLRFILDSVS